MEDVVVLNFGTYLAGPLAARHLQNMGAKIITIKSPTTMAEEKWNPDVCHELLKGHIVHHINLKDASKAKEVQELVKSANVLIENFRPGVMESFGLGFEACNAMNPKLVYLSLKGFYSGDFEYKDVKAYENIIMAASGVFKDMGLNRQLMGIPASYSDLPLASSYASIYAALAVSSKLFMLKLQDSLSPDDLKIEVPLASALSEALMHNSLDFPKPYNYMNMRSRHISEKCSNLSYEEIQELMDPFYSHYICSDGRPFYLVAPFHRTHQIRTLEILGLSHLNISIVSHS